MRIWDRGTFETIKWEERKVEVIFHGERLRGRYGLFPIGRTAESANDWMIHRMDPPLDPDRAPMPEHVAPMLARAAHALPPAQQQWSFEVKWDGVRAIAYAQPGRLRLESRNGREITVSYPEVRGLARDLGMREAVLDGEIVAFDERGRPSFETLQHRMHVTSPAAVRRLAASSPVVYAIFDLLYLDGHSLMDLPYTERRAALEALALNGPSWRVPAVRPGDGDALLRATAEQGLEGIVAKRLDSRYVPGARNGAWLKIKHTQRQELVIGGWLPGEGRRTERIGALLMGYSRGRRAALCRAGRNGLHRASAGRSRGTARAAAAGRSVRSCARRSCRRDAHFVEPALVAEVEFTEWTADGVMRAPSFKGLREDKDAREVVREDGDAGTWGRSRSVVMRGGRSLVLSGAGARAPAKAASPPAGASRPSAMGPGCARPQLVGWRAPPRSSSRAAGGAPTARSRSRSARAR